MKRTLPSFGFLIFVIVMAIVLWLVVKAWLRIAPTADQILSMQSHEASQTTDEQAPESRRLPDLNMMQRNTKQHTEDVERIQEELD